MVFIKKAPKTEMTRTQAVRALQMSLSDFRKLCILKGVYPCPAPKGEVKHRTYYSIRDIKSIGTEPVLRKFREIKASVKKINRAKNRQEKHLEDSLQNQRPYLDLTGILKERYPDFSDALYDMDDALTMIHLFATLPSNKEIPRPLIERCQAIVGKWNSYVTDRKCLRAAFLSIKGIYVQTQVLDETVTYIVPYSFSQSMEKDVDYRVMVSFVELYCALMESVLFKFSNMAGQNALNAEANENIEETDIENIFKDMIFYLNRETPRTLLKLFIECCGGVAEWEEHGRAVDDQEITHHVVDRKIRNPIAGRSYLLPQWVVDCVNQKTVLPLNQYRPGETLPYHMSPFVKDEDVELSMLGERAEDIEEDIEAVDRKRSAGEQEAMVAMMSRKNKAIYREMMQEEEKKKQRVEAMQTRKEYHASQRKQEEGDATNDGEEMPVLEEDF
ncbi:hypothetical protein PCE1_003625 [Barthelona sp. PCE]